ncbi:MAG: ABC transporter substrate-binding protein [Spirochaetes bacterium]|nr:ABC transporter substrate-binding protein [Spirochaetota bacterium]
MKKLFSLAVALFVFSVLLIPQIGCKKKVQTSGVYRIITSQPPQMMSYTPMMGPGDSTAVMPAVERLIEATETRDEAGGMEPWLAEKIDEDVNGLTIVWHIRKGVKFHDGTDLNAEAVRWNFQQVIDAKALPYSSYLKSMKVTGEYTLEMKLTAYSNQLVPSWGYWPIIVSKEAWEKASGGDVKKGIEWARTHVVGTGPFMLKEYKRDVSCTWVRNPNYWIKDRPYLEGMEFRYIPDGMTASAMMQAKEADSWEGASAKDQKALMDQGLKRQASWPALGYSLWVNTANPKSKWQDKRVREALEYALDKPAIAKALGVGLFEELWLPPKGEWGSEGDNKLRPYNPEKAKQLLKEAGFPNGMKAKLLVFFTPDSKDAGTAIKQYLDEAGFDIQLDIADPGRFFGSVYGPPPGPDADLALWITGRDNNYLQSYMRWFSTEPFTDLSYLGHTPEQQKMDKWAQSLTSLKDQEEACKKCVGYITDNALVIPVFDVPSASMIQPWVHETRWTTGFTRWKTHEVWMDEH